MTPRGIRLLQGKRRTLSYTVKGLNSCCAQHDPRLHGCGFTGLCRKLYDQRDSDWEWGRRFIANRWRPSLQHISDWLVCSIPGARTSRKEGAQ